MKPSKNEPLIKNTIPGIIKAIQQAGEDKNKISDLENLLISMYASSLLFLAAIANFIVLFFILSQDIEGDENYLKKEMAF